MSRVPVIYLECTATFRFDHGTGIQRVVRNVIRYFQKLAPMRGFDVVPIYFERGQYYRAPTKPDGSLLSLAEGPNRHSRRLRVRRVLDHLTRSLPGAARDFVAAPSTSPGLARSARAILAPLGHLRRALGPAENRTPVVIAADDILLHVDLSADSGMHARLAALRAQGTFICAIINDLIPLRISEIWPPSFVVNFRLWIDCMIANCDCIFTISRATKGDVERYRNELPATSHPPSQTIEWFHLGHDMDVTDATGTARGPLRDIFAAGVPVLLNVGWLDPRKNQRGLIAALAQLHRRGVRAKLLLVGKKGMDADAVFADIHANPQVARDIHMFHDLTDAELQFAFTHARALVYPSFAEGFGLPLVEALMHRMPVFASDIPVFHEIAGGHAVYFDPFDADLLANILEAYLVRGEYPASMAVAHFHWISWEQSVTRLFDLLQQSLPRKAAA